MVTGKSTQLCLSKMNFNIPIAKKFWLGVWVQNSLQEAQGQSASTAELFNLYRVQTPKEKQLTEREFSLDLEPMMRALGWDVFKTRNRKGRGFTGVAIADIDQSANSKELVDTEVVV